MLLCLMSSPSFFFICTSIYIIVTITVGLRNVDLAALMSLVLMIVLLFALGFKKAEEKKSKSLSDE